MTNSRGYHIEGIGFDLIIEEGKKPYFLFLKNSATKDATISTMLSYINTYQQQEILKQLTNLNKTNRRKQ